MAICPICGAEVRPRGANKSFPFCTSRCQSIDLGKWLDEDYRVPSDPVDGENVDAEVAEPAEPAEGSARVGREDMRH